MKKLCLLALSVLSGCSPLEFESIRTGIAFREVKARWKIYDKSLKLPLARVQGNFKLNEKTEGWLRADFTAGHVDHRQYLTHIRARGSFFAAGSGLSYYPFCENFSFDLGGEIFYTNIRSIKGDFFGIKNEINDDIFGVGLNAGVSVNIPLNEKFFISSSAGYNWTDTFTRKISADFDGWYVFFGLGMKLK